MAGALIGALRVSLSAETSAFEAGMKRSQRTAQRTANSIKGSFGSIRGELGLLKAGVAGFVGALSVGTIIAAGKAALDYAGSIGEVAQQLGVTTKDLQAFRYAAGQTGVSQEQLETGLSKLTVTLGRVAAGAKQPIAALNAIGVSADQLRGKDTGEAFRIIADGLAKVEDRSQRAAVEVALFGRSGAQLDNLLAGGSAKVNELAAAAEELGIVLSDAQIQKADDTADKLEALQVVLKARIAGAVADNADSILQLADAIAEAANAAARALAPLRNFYIEAQKAWANAQIGAIDAVNSSFGGMGRFLPGAKNRAANRAAAVQSIADINRQQADARWSALFRGRTKGSGGGGAIPQFLAGGGGGGRRGGRDRSAEEALRKQLDALRDANRFDQDLLRAKQDVLQAQRDLARNADDRANIDLELLSVERRQYEGELAYEVRINELTKGAEGISQAQADQLLEHYSITESLKREAINREQDAANRERIARLVDVDFDIEREKLELQGSLAETAAEQRDVALRLLDLYYRQERARLDTIMAEEEVGSLAWEEARRRRAALDQTMAAKREGVIAQTRGPFEEYVSELPNTTEKWNEALENVAANGLRSVEDGLVDILTGAKSVGEALYDILGSIIEQLIRIGVQKAIVSVIGGGIGFDSGGYTGNVGVNTVAGVVHGQEYVVNARATKRFLPLLEAINSGKVPGMAMGGLAGLPIARTSFGSRVSVNDNAARGGDSFSFHFPGITNAREARTAGIQAAGAFRRAVARDVKVNG